MSDESFDRVVKPFVRRRASLTRREQEVVELVADGLANPEIAERLVISTHTVKTHMSRIFSKLGMMGRSELRDA